MLLLINEDFFNSYILQLNDIEMFSQIVDIGSTVSYSTRNKIIHGMDINEERDLPEKMLYLGNFVEVQEKKGFPFLYNLLSIRIWTLLEAFVDEFLIKLILEEENLRSIKEIEKLKGELLNFIYKSRYEQADFILELLKSDQKNVTGFGVNRFESLLKIFGHDGQVEETVKRQLMELSQIRNVLVHKNGKADGRLVTNCSWLGINEGDEVNLDMGHFIRYMSSVHWYILEVFRRHFIKTNRNNFNEYLIHLQKETLEDVFKFVKIKNIRKKIEG